MFKKRCVRCGKISYSGTQYGTWICPYCGRDLTGLKAGISHINRCAANKERKMFEMRKKDGPQTTGGGDLILRDEG